MAELFFLSALSAERKSTPCLCVLCPSALLRVVSLSNDASAVSNSPLLDYADGVGPKGKRAPPVGLFRQLVCDSRHALSHEVDVEVQEKSQPNTGQFEVCQKLRLVDGLDLFA